MSEPDRTKLPIRRPPFAGVANRTLDGSQPDWNLIGHPRRRTGAPNVLLVLIDDAGFGNPSTFGGPIDTPNYTRMAEGGLRYNRFHVTALCSPDPGRAADRSQQPRRRLRLDRRVLERLPRLHGHPAAGLCAAAPDPAGQRLQHRGVRQVAPDAGRSAGPGRAVRPLAERLGLRLLLRLPRRRRQPVGPVPGREPEDHRHAAGVLRRGEPLLPARRHGRQDDRVAPRRARRRTRPSRSSSTSRPGAATRRTTSRRPGPTSTRASSTRAGTGCARRSSPGRRRSASIPADAELTPRDEAFPAWDDVPGQAQGLLRAADGGLRRLLGERRPQRRPRDRRDRGAGRARQHADHLDLG